MVNYDTNILIRNIKTLMENNNVKQEGLATILGMSQPNISKALSNKDKKAFTLDQVVGIAKHFNVSVDMLVGISKDTTVSHSPRSIANFISELISSHQANLFSYEKEEEIFDVNYDNGYAPECSRKKEKILYPAIYLPSYSVIETQDDFEMATQCGNDTMMITVNKFLFNFKKLYDIYIQGNMDRELYEATTSNMLERLSDKC